MNFVRILDNSITKYNEENEEITPEYLKEIKK